MTVLTLAVPAGSYVAEVELTLLGDLDTFTQVICEIPGADDRMTLRQAAGYEVEEEMEIRSAFVHSGGAIDLRCLDNSISGLGALARSATLLVTKVDSVNAGAATSIRRR